MPKMDRTIAKTTKAEFKKKARTETLSKSAVGESLDRMTGASQEMSNHGSNVRDKLHRRAKQLGKTK